MKIDNLRNNPALTKLELLVNGVQFPKGVELKENEAPERYIYDSSVATRLKLPSEIILPQNVISNVFLSENSPLSIMDRKLFYNGEEVCDIGFTPEAKFSKINLSDGTSASKVAVMYGLDIFAIFLNKYCIYFREGEECKFCSIEYTRKQKGKDNPINLKLAQVVETLRSALSLDRERFNYVMVTSGAYSNPDRGILEQMKYIDAMRKIDDGKLEYHLVTIPPVSQELLHKLAKEGPNTVAFDIEVFSPELFKKFCSGKEKQIGYDNWLKIFENSSKLFQKNAVKAGFVCGLEPIETLVQGMEFFGKLGIPSSLNIFHPDEGTALANHPRPSREYLLEAFKEQARINKKYDLIPIFPKFGRRSSLDTEVYRGFLDDNTS
jgi:hypothetical protein